MGPLFSLIFGLILGFIFLIVCRVLFIYGQRTGNWRALKFAIGIGALASLLVAFSLGSDLIFFLRLTKNQPEVASLTGTWKQGDQASYPSEITLQSDGSFISNGPSYVRGGRWHLKREGDRWGITFTLGSNSGSDSPTLMYLGLVGRSAPYRLYNYIGDPDSGEMVLYTQADR